jgi:hypothetical protein
MIVREAGTGDRRTSSIVAGVRLLEELLFDEK